MNIDALIGRLYIYKTYMIPAIIFLLGLVFGSFLSALASREGTKNSIWRGRSACPHCQKKLSAQNLIPIFSFIFLKGRCQHCHKAIPWHEPLVELGTGLAFLTAGFVHNWTLDPFLIRDLIFTIFFVLLFLTDIYHGLLPHRFTIIATVVAFIFNTVIRSGGQLPIAPAVLFDPIIGALVCGGFFFLQHVLSGGRWVGGGDVGMGLFLGAALGLWSGLWALGLAYVVGAIFAIYLLVTKKATAKSQIPFGPFLAVAGWIVLITTAL